MKYILITLLTIISFSLSAQVTDTIFNGYLSPIVRSGGTAPNFNFRGIFRNKLLSSNGFDTTGVQLEIMTSSDGNCYRLPVTSITTISSPVVSNTTIEGTALDVSGELATIPSGVAAIYTKTVNFELIPDVEKLPEDLKTCIFNYNIARIDSLQETFGAGVDSSFIRNDSVFIASDGLEFYSGNNSASLAFDSNRPILRVPTTGTTIGGSTVTDWLEYWYFAPPSLASSIIGGTVFEVGTSNSLTFRSTLSNAGLASLTSYVLSESTKGTQVAVPNTSAPSLTTDFGFTYTPLQTPVGGVGVWDAQSYTFQSSANWSASGSSGSISSPNRTIQGVYPVLYGMVVDTATAFANPYGTMTKLVQTEGNKTVSFTGTGLIFYGFPQTWADTNLSSIIDPNGFNVTPSFTRVTYPVVTSTGLVNNYTSVPYVFYFLNTGTTTTNNSNYTFNR